MSSSQLVTFRVLSVWQPWADFLVADEAYRAALRVTHPELAELLPKDVENRGYGTDWTGVLLIHASKRFDAAAMAKFDLDPASFVRGAVVGLVRLDGVVVDSPSRWAQPGRKHWKVSGPLHLDSPVECNGFQGAPRPPTPEVAAAVLTRLHHQRRQAATR